MSRKLIACALLCASSAFAGPVAVWKGENVKVYAYTEDCEVPSLALVLSQFGGKARKASVQEGSREYAACYVLQDDKVLIVDSEGSGGYINAADFKEDKGA
jgi:hypothetical protein